MALRDGRGARLRRVARGRAGFVALAAALYLVAGVVATWPAVKHADSAFLADRARVVNAGRDATTAPGWARPPAVPPGDHLQTAYGFWLFGHQLERGSAPWLDPYSFRPASDPVVSLRGWLFGAPYWPLERAFDVVVAWNTLVLLGYLAAGGLACAWLRELRLPRGAALAGGLAFALAPYRVVQSTGHLLGPISILLPLALFAFERARRGGRGWLLVAGAALASIPLSGQVHLALGAIPFFLAYALCRSRERRLVVGSLAAALVAVAAGLLVREVAIEGSIASGGRSLDAVGEWSAGALDLVLREPRHGSERFVYLGWLTPLLAAAGVVLLLRARRRALALVLAAGAVVPIVLALGTNTPVYSLLWHIVPPLQYPRVPGRLMPIACLALAALAAFAIARLRVRWVPIVAVALLFVDLRVEAYGAARADPGNAASAALRAQPAGRVLELPVFMPPKHYGSVYDYYALQAQRERPSGYSTLAPREAARVLQRLERLNCGEVSPELSATLARLDVRYFAFHDRFFLRNRDIPDRAWFAWQALARARYRPIARDGAVTVLARGRAVVSGPRLVEPRRDVWHFCQHWRGDARGGVMTAEHGAFWLHGEGRVRLRLAAARPLRATLAVDGERVLRRRIHGAATVTLPLGTPGWHLVAIDVPHLVETEGEKNGLRVARAPS